jgi:ubiquinone/menaquinone biosynthesis C-methylase UbiE
VCLTDELAERRRPEPLRERRDLARMAVGSVGEEVSHDGSMLGRVSESVADTWSGASYERLAETYAPIHDRVVEALALRPGMRVLDVACGTGAVALRVARVGADVVGVDISPDQLAKAREAAGAEGLSITFQEGDCQELPFDNAEFGAVVSTFGAVFAFDHERTAAELARVCRPGGRLALTAWLEDGWSHVNARAGRTYPEGPDPHDWAREEHVQSLLGNAFDLELQSGEWRIAADSGAELWEFVSASMPPLRTWLAEQSDERRARAEQVYLEYLASGVLARDYVLVLGTRR